MYASQHESRRGALLLLLGAPLREAAQRRADWPAAQLQECPVRTRAALCPCMRAIVPRAAAPPPFGAPCDAQALAVLTHIVHVRAFYPCAHALPMHTSCPHAGGLPINAASLSCMAGAHFT